MQHVSEKRKAGLHFTYLPLFAKFILENKLGDFVTDQLQLSRELNLPLLSHFSSMSEDELKDFSRKSATDFLNYLINNKAEEQIESARKRWLANQLPIVSKDEIQAEDITGVSYVRKQAFINQIPFFSTDINTAIRLVSEISEYIFISETVFAATYISILNTRIDEHAHFISRITETSPGIIYVFDVNERKDIYINKTVQEFLGYTREDVNEMANTMLTSLVHPEDLPLIARYEENFGSIADGEIRSVRYRIKNKQGEYRWLRTYESVFKRDAEGKVVQKIGIGIDVHNEKMYADKLHQHEAQLQQNEELYKQAQALSHIGNWTWLIKDNRILWSDEMFRIYGLSPQSEEINFERFASFIHPEDKEELFNTIQNCLSSHEAYDLYHRIILPEGEIKYLHARGRVQTDSTGQPSQMVGTGQDVTQRLKIEREARESQRFIQKIADAAPALITSYNVHTGKYRFISQGLKNLLGYDPKQPLEEGVQFFINIMHPEDLTPIMEKNTAALQLADNSFNDNQTNEPIVEYEYRIRHANGEYRWFHTYGTVFDRNAAGKVEHVLNISIDTTERKEMENALSQKNMQLEQSNSNLEEFAYVASHDLKEPLRKISIFGDRLLSSQYEHLGSDGRFYLEKIIDSSKKMQVLINDLLSLSLISGNKSFEQHSLQLVLEDVMRTLEYKIEEKNVVINAPRLPEAKINLAQFRQLFQNLLSNSLKFVQQDTQVVIDIGYRWLKKQDIEKFKLQRANRYLELTFSDNGIGFDNVFAGKIFAIFQRLHHKDYEGTGIGLAICKKIVENHGGIIFANGEPGKGATFTIIIPV
ncbi:MAG TPA: PAS domain-containing protein [Chitinophagaceae bacterium]